MSQLQEGRKQVLRAPSGSVSLLNSTTTFRGLQSHKKKQRFHQCCSFSSSSIAAVSVFHQAANFMPVSRAWLLRIPFSLPDLATHLLLLGSLDLDHLGPVNPGNCLWGIFYSIPGHSYPLLPFYGETRFFCDSYLMNFSLQPLITWNSGGRCP